MMLDLQPACWNQDHVSILVVLDWTMMLYMDACDNGVKSGFNPCCIGLDNDAP